MSIIGLHHITLVCTDAQRTVDFYTRILGLRFVKKTVNFDDPGSYHLYFGDELGSPGTAITFFEWRHAKKGYPGIGGTHHFALQVADYAGLLQWKRYLTGLGIEVQGPRDRVYFKSIYLQDPDGVILEIATNGPGWAVDEEPNALGKAFRSPPASLAAGTRDDALLEADTWSEPVPAITEGMRLSRGMHHITAISSDIERTHAFFGDLLGMRRVKMTANFDDPNSAHWYWGVGDGQPGTLLTYFERSPDRERHARMGAGQTHHFALAVADDAVQLEWREKLLGAGLRVTPVLDRTYFKSIYTSDPDGHIVELATVGPGFTVDEEPASLGTSLKLPPWLERRRAEIEPLLAPLHTAERVEPEKSE